MNKELEAIALRFKSGNGVPVERAHITATEWAAIVALYEDAERYRWLADEGGAFGYGVHSEWLHTWYGKESLDAAIDAARSAR